MMLMLLALQCNWLNGAVDCNLMAKSSQLQGPSREKPLEAFPEICSTYWWCSEVGRTEKFGALCAGARSARDPMVFQWFPMVANHWSNNGMVTIHRYGLVTFLSILHWPYFTLVKKWTLQCIWDNNTWFHMFSTTISVFNSNFCPYFHCPTFVSCTDTIQSIISWVLLTACNTSILFALSTKPTSNINNIGGWPNRQQQINQK